MVDEKMCLGVIKDELMARIDPADYDAALNVKGARPMDFTKKTMKGFIYVESHGLELDEDLKAWVDKCLDFNPRAKSSKK